MFSLPILVFVLTAADSTWHTDYDRATRQAIEEKKDQLIYFGDDERLNQAFQDDEVREKLKRFVCLRLSIRGRTAIGSFGAPGNDGPAGAGDCQLP